MQRWHQQLLGVRQHGKFGVGSCEYPLWMQHCVIGITWWLRREQEIKFVEQAWVDNLYSLSLAETAPKGLEGWRAICTDRKMNLLRRIDLPPLSFTNGKCCAFVWIWMCVPRDWKSPSDNPWVSIWGNSRLNPEYESIFYSKWAETLCKRGYFRFWHFPTRISVMRFHFRDRP